MHFSSLLGRGLLLFPLTSSDKIGTLSFSAVATIALKWVSENTDPVGFEGLQIKMQAVLESTRLSR